MGYSAKCAVCGVDVEFRADKSEPLSSVNGEQPTSTFPRVADQRAP